MTTPVYKFVCEYDKAHYARLHMPGHKGKGPLGEEHDITEIEGADDLYRPTGIIAEAEANTAALFGARRTCWSTEGSSQCVKAMLCLAVTYRRPGTAPVVLSARNVHKSFVQAAALVGFDVEWLWSEEGESTSLCACPITAQGLERALSAMAVPPCAVYVTSPDYLGNMLDIRSLADAAHRHGTILLVDNAHGAYLKLLQPSRHPMDLGADLCCDSAHKTLPVLTGGAYLHIGKNAPAGIEDHAKQAMALFGSTSPSYLIMASLDRANEHLAAQFHAGSRRIDSCIDELDRAKAELTGQGWTLVGEEPLKVTVCTSAGGWDGRELAARLRDMGAMPEYADPDHLVLMFSPEDLDDIPSRLTDYFSELRPPLERPALPLAKGERAMSIRQAVMAPSETVPAAAALGRVCASPAVSCPPAVPIAVSGEVISPAALELFRYYGVEQVDVVKA